MSIVYKPNAIKQQWADRIPPSSKQQKQQKVKVYEIVPVYLRIGLFLPPHLRRRFFNVDYRTNIGVRIVQRDGLRHPHVRMIMIRSAACWVFRSCELYLLRDAHVPYWRGFIICRVTRHFLLHTANSSHLGGAQSWQPRPPKRECSSIVSNELYRLANNTELDYPSVEFSASYCHSCRIRTRRVD